MTKSPRDAKESRSSKGINHYYYAFGRVVTDTAYTVILSEQPRVADRNCLPHVFLPIIKDMIATLASEEASQVVKLSEILFFPLLAN